MKVRYSRLFYRIDHFIKKGGLTPIKPQYLRRIRDVAVVPESEIKILELLNL